VKGPESFWRIYEDPRATVCSTALDDVMRILDRMDRRKQLERYIADTRTNQRTFNWVIGVMFVVALGLMIAGTNIGILAMLIVGIVGIGGHWVMYAHLASHQTELANLGRRRAAPEGPQSGGHRRWDHAVEN
jgi:hypothetical protein